jgi:putative restriction endonuclease
MNRDAVLQQFDRLNLWRRRGQRAPHKPLLILYALGRWVRGETGDIPFAEVNRDLATLLQEFGPPRRSTHPEYPFWRLQNDGVWVVNADGTMKPRQSNSDPPKGELLAHHARAGFADGVKAALQADPTLVTAIASRLLDNHFPESLHPDILAAVGLDLATAVATSVARKRDPKFRQRVLTAYEYRCAVCGFDVRLGSVAVALDAAHIRWHQAAGPDREDNGLALCVLHHKLFDLGAFTLDQGGLLLVSDQVHGTAGFQEALLRHHGGPVRKPQRPEWVPAPAFLEWHGQEVFKGEARHHGSVGETGDASSAK